jgi:hypothetical protein
MILQHSQLTEKATDSDKEREYVAQPALFNG